MIPFFVEAASLAFGLQDVRGSNVYPGPRGGTYTSALRKTLMMDTRFSGERLEPHEDIANLSGTPPADFMPMISNAALRHSKWQTSLHAERNAFTSGRSFAATNGGYLAIVNADAKPGHTIFILNGASVPIVLEKYWHIPPRYHWVGERYVPP